MEDEGEGTIHLEIDSRLTEVRLVAIAVRQIAALVLPEEAAAEFEIAVVEAVNNAIEHAYANQPGHVVRVGVRLESQAVRVEVADRGRTMPPDLDPNAAAMPVFDPDDLDSLPEGGMGLALVRAAVDELSYASRGDGWNVMTLVRRKAAPPPEEAQSEWPALLEAAKLDNLRMAIGDDAFGQMVTFLPNEIERNLAVIRQGLDVGDLDMARHGAHKLRGQVGIFGALRIEAIGRAMELDAPDLPALRALLPHLLQAVSDTAEALRS